MLKSLRVRNYRVFNDLKIDGLHRINLIAGKNNSGKTSLLEAIFLLAGGGNPQFAINSNVIRGPDLGIGSTPHATESVWKYFFFALNMGRPIQIEANHSKNGPIRLGIAPERPDVTRLPLDSTQGVSASDVQDGRSLAFTYSDQVTQESKSFIRLAPQGIDTQGPETHTPFNARIILSRTVNDLEYPTLLGRLRTRKEGDLLLQALQVIEPRLQSVEDSMASGVPMIWGDIGLSEMIPLQVMGEGMSRLARLILGIASTPGGVVLVDEVENGIHHSVMSSVWKAIGKAAKQFDTQIFATTHSFECIETAAEGLGPEGFRLYRLRSNEGTNRAIRYEPDEVELAIRRGLEVR